MVFNRLFKKSSEYERSAMKCLSAYFDAHTFVKNNKFRKYLLISGLAFLILFSFSINALINGVNYVEAPITNWLLPYLQKIFTFTVEELTQGVTAIFWLLKKAISANKDAIFSSFFLIIGTPFFSYISSKTEEIETGKKYPFSIRIFLREIRRGISISVRNSLKQLGLILVITLLGLIPFVGIITPLLAFAIQAYFNGILMTDYTLERQGYTVKESEAFYKIHKPEMFAIGLGFMFILLIPVIGWFIAPTYGLVASYLYFSKKTISY